MLQPDGSFAFIAPASTAGSARDGALYQVDVPALGSPNGAVVAYYPSGEHKVIGNFTLPESITRFESLDEEADGTIHLVLRGAAFHYYVQLKQAAPPRTVRLEALNFAEFRFGHGYGAGDRRSVVSRDGFTWALTSPPPDHWVGPATVAGHDVVTRIGAIDGGRYRLHWGRDVSPLPAPIEPERASADTPAAPELPLVRCTRRGSSPSLGIVADPAELRSAARPGMRVRSWSDDDRSLPFLLEESGRDEEGAPPSSWKVTWSDRAEIGGLTRTWSGPAHGNVWTARVVGTSMRAGKLAFALVYPNKRSAVVRIDAKGTSEVRELSSEDRPLSPLVFGVDKKDTIAWLAPTGLLVWQRGAKPRKVGHLSSTRGLVPSPVTERAVTVRAHWGTELLSHELSLVSGVESPRLPTLTWTRSAAPFVAGALPKACPKGANDPLFGWSGRLPFAVELDGKTLLGPAASYQLRLSTEGVCAETAFFTFDSHKVFIRADFPRQLMESGTIGATGKDSVATVTCDGLSPK